MSSTSELPEALEFGAAPESAGPALVWLDAHGRTFDHFIDGRWQPPNGGQRFTTHEPATGAPLAELAHGSAADVHAAVQAARSALEPWQRLSGQQRARVLYAIARQVQKHSRLFAVLEAIDNGKPIRETRDIDIPLVARHFYHHAGYAATLEQHFPGAKPLGVCGQIIPWNFPLLMLAWKLAPALAAGNTCVLKPAEFTSLTALLFAEVCNEAGLPPGVVNIVTGEGATGAALVEHPDVAKIAFTGSTEVGRIIRKATGGTGKKLSLELGGKSPFLVFEDADLDSAVEGLVDAIWFNQGQVCCAGSRLLVQESIAQRALDKVRARMERLRVGHPLDKSIDIGAIVAPVQLERIRALVEQGAAEGAEVFRPSWACPQEGWFYPPTLLTNVGPASTVAQVEIFGPVLVAMTFRTPAEGIELANNTPYGLAASVWTESLSTAHEVAAQLKAGTVWINCTNRFDAAAGFGGYRESGFGREGGRAGMLEYLELPALAWPKGGAPVHAEPSDGERIDRTHKLLIGGRQVRPDGGYSFALQLADGSAQEFALANRKDVREAVEAARGAQPAWHAAGGHSRAQVLYYLAENLEAACAQMRRALELSGSPEPAAELQRSIQACFEFAAWADKYDGRVHGVPGRQLVYSLNEPLGVIGIACPPDRGLEGLLGLALPCLAMGNAVVCVPSKSQSLPAAELYRVIEASDVPGGVLNLLTGEQAELLTVLAEHLGVDGVFCFSDPDLGAAVQRASAGNLKQTWVWDKPGFWPAAESMLARATQVKTVWTPYGA